METIPKGDLRDKFSRISHKQQIKVLGNLFHMLVARVLKNNNVFSRIGTEYEDLLRKSLYSVQIWENMDRKNSKYGHFSCREWHSQIQNLVMTIFTKTHTVNHGIIVLGIVSNFCFQY